MIFPIQLTPTSFESVELLSGTVVQVPKTTPTFQPWHGPKLPDTYGGKAVLDCDGEALFAELVVRKLFVQAGWDGVWVDSYSRKYRKSFTPEGIVELPDGMSRLLDCIYARAGNRNGCFDVFCWRGQDYIIAECKKCSEDQLRTSQKLWLQSALACGVPRESLLIVEWTVGRGLAGQNLD